MAQSTYFNLNKTTSSTAGSQQQTKPKINLFDFKTTQSVQPTSFSQFVKNKTSTPQNIMNFGPGVSQKGVTNVNEYNPATKKTENIFTPKPITTEQSSGFSLIPTANADNGKMSLQEFGEMIKTKYPDYKNIDSIELGKKMLDKYPIYSNKVEINAEKTQPEAPQEQGFFESIKYKPYSQEELTSYDPNKTTTQNILEGQGKYAKNIAGGLYNIVPGVAEMGTNLVTGTAKDVGMKVGNLFGLVSDEDRKAYDKAMSDKTGKIVGGVATDLKQKYIDSTIYGLTKVTNSLGLSKQYGDTEYLKNTIMTDPTAIIGDVLSFVGVGIAGKSKLTNIQKSALETQKSNIINQVKNATTLEEKSALIKQGIETSKEILNKTKDINNLKDAQSVINKYNPYIQVPVTSGKVILKSVEKTGNKLNEIKTNKLAEEELGNNIKLEKEVGKVIQGETSDIKPAIETLKVVDTQGVKDYKDLLGRVKDKQKNIVALQDNLLQKEGGQYGLSNTEKVIDTAIGTKKTNYVSNAINDIKREIDEIGSFEDYNKKLFGKEKTLGDVIVKIENNTASLEDINDLARYYNGNFRDKIYTKTGEPKNSTLAGQYETNRKGVKDFVRDQLPTDELKQLDMQYSNIAETKRLIEKVIEGVNKLEQKIKERGILEKGARLIAKGVDIASMGTVRGFFTGLLPSNIGNKINNFLDIQGDLSKHLKEIEKLLNKKDLNAKDIQNFTTNLKKNANNNTVSIPSMNNSKMNAGLTTKKPILSDREKLLINKPKNAIPNQTTTISSKDGGEVLETKIDENFKLREEQLLEDEKNKFLNFLDRQKEEGSKKPIKIGDIINNNPKYQGLFKQAEEKKAKNEKAIMTIYGELEGSKAGERVFNGYGADKEVIGISSTFPKYIPEKSRTTPIITRIIKHLNDGDVPNPKNVNVYEGYQAVIKRFESLGGDTKIFLKKLLPSNFKEKAQETVEKIADKIGARQKLLGGEGAKLAPKSGLELAKSLDGKINADAIWQKTGWEKGTDGKWRFEIDDSKAKVKEIDNNKLEKAHIENMDKQDKLARAIMLPDLLDHPQLFEQYPNLNSVKVYFSNKSSLGGFDNDLVITLNDKFLNKGSSKLAPLYDGAKLQDPKSTLLHEIQHYIQSKEGFARGGNVETATATKDFIKKINNQIDTLKKDIEVKNDLLKSNDIEFNAELDGYKDIDKYKQFLKSEIYKASDKIKKLENYDMSEFDKYQGYKSLAGETEARNVQSRLLKTPNERKLLRPAKTEDVDRKLQIVKMDGGKSMSIGADKTALLKGSDDLIKFEGREYIKEGNKYFKEVKNLKGEKVKMEVKNLGLLQELKAYEKGGIGEVKNMRETIKINRNTPKEKQSEPTGDFSRTQKDIDEMRKSGELITIKDYNNKTQAEILGKGTKFYTPYNSNGKLTIYRATIGDNIRVGDYVSNSKAYAEDHLKRVLHGEGKILKLDNVGIDELAVVNPNEFWYAPKQAQKPKLLKKTSKN